MRECDGDKFQFWVDLELQNTSTGVVTVSRRAEYRGNVLDGVKKRWQFRLDTLSWIMRISTMSTKLGRFPPHGTVTVITSAPQRCWERQTVNCSLRLLARTIRGRFQVLCRWRFPRKHQRPLGAPLKRVRLGLVVPLQIRLSLDHQVAQWDTCHHLPGNSSRPVDNTTEPVWSMIGKMAFGPFFPRDLFIWRLRILFHSCAQKNFKKLCCVQMQSFAGMNTDHILGGGGGIWFHILRSFASEQDNSWFGHCCWNNVQQIKGLTVAEKFCSPQTAKGLRCQQERNEKITKRHCKVTLTVQHFRT